MSRHQPPRTRVRKPVEGNKYKLVRAIEWAPEREASPGDVVCVNYVDASDSCMVTILPYGPVITVDWDDLEGCSSW